MHCTARTEAAAPFHFFCSFVYDILKMQKRECSLKWAWLISGWWYWLLRGFEWEWKWKSSSSSAAAVAKATHFQHTRGASIRQCRKIKNSLKCVFSAVDGLKKQKKRQNQNNLSSIEFTIKKLKFLKGEELQTLSCWQIKLHFVSTLLLLMHFKFLILISKIKNLAAEEEHFERTCFKTRR